MFYTYIYIRKCSLDICTTLLHYGMTHNQIVFPAYWSQYFSGYLLAYTKYAGYFTQNILHITVVYLDDCEFLFMYIIKFINQLSLFTFLSSPPTSCLCSSKLFCIFSSTPQIQKKATRTLSAKPLSSQVLVGKLKTIYWQQAATEVLHKRPF